MFYFSGFIRFTRRSNFKLNLPEEFLSKMKEILKGEFEQFIYTSLIAIKVLGLTLPKFQLKSL